METDGIGFLTIAIGHEKYLRQARTLARSLRRNMPGFRLAIVTDSEALREVADVIIPPRKDISTGVLHKLFVGDYSPFSQTLFIDSDCIVARSFERELAELRQFDFTPAMERFIPITGADEYIEDLARALSLVQGTRFPKFNGGIYFFRRGPVASKIFSLAQQFHRDYRRYGIRPFDKSGPGEETVIGLALAQLAVQSLYFDGGRLMRTPTGLKGRIAIDPLGGGCEFERFDGVVSPAICHFAGKYLLSATYRLASHSLEYDIPMKDLDLSTRLVAHANAQIDRIRTFAGYKVHGVRKRLGLLNEAAR